MLSLTALSEGFAEPRLDVSGSILGRWLPPLQ
jgi:hypothetical protein